VPASKLGEQKLADIYLEFIEIGNEQSAKLAKQLNFIVSNDLNLVSENEDKEVSTREVSLKAAKSLYDAATYYERGEHKHALSTLNSALGKIRGINKSPYRTKDTIVQQKVVKKSPNFSCFTQNPHPIMPPTTAVEKNGKVLDVKL